MAMRLKIIFLLVIFISGCTPDTEPVSWKKGNLHTHSFWSDGDDFPEVIASWYRENGYDFLAISDHNTIAEGEKWLHISKTHIRYQTFQNYLDAFSDDWVEFQDYGDTISVRLKTYPQYLSRFQMHTDFLLIRAEEVTDRFEDRPIHVNATNVMEYIRPRGGSSALQVMQNNIDAILDQRTRLGRPVMPHINHPNFGWALNAEELAELRGEKFFEVYNGHPAVNNEGDSTHIGMEKMWDVINTIRLEEGKEMMYGIATDDAHHYQEQAISKANAGRGWVVVKASELTAESLIGAMESGAFYASSGVELVDVSFDGAQYSISVRAETGVSYVIEFIGTLKEHDPLPEPENDANGEPGSMRYSDDIGRVLQRFKGSEAVYTMSGRELFVRARITSSRKKSNPNFDAETERAWTQPVMPSN